LGVKNNFVYGIIENPIYGSEMNLQPTLFGTYEAATNSIRGIFVSKLMKGVFVGRALYDRQETADNIMVFRMLQPNGSIYTYLIRDAQSIILQNKPSEIFAPRYKEIISDRDLQKIRAMPRDIIEIINAENQIVFARW
jgi:hypothetical protein